MNGPPFAPEAAEPRRPVWKNPFVLGFVVGIVVLTAIPFLQRPFLKAPPPLLAMGEWSLRGAGGGPVTSAQLRGAVWIVQTCAQGACPAATETFGRMAAHVDDLDGRVRLLTLVVPEGDAAAPLDAVAAGRDSARWRFATGAPAELSVVVARLRAGLGQLGGDGGTDTAGFSRAGALALIDQRGDLRGLWPDDVDGRGNVINAARLLARSGAAPRGR